MATKEELKGIFVTGAIPTEEDFHDLIDVAGEKGEPGEDGAKGDAGSSGAKGDAGEKGADGFGTESQYDDIISRLDALEGGGD